jgi:membrane-associated protease RseP (regulator of RpoE activity)
VHGETSADFHNREGVVYERSMHPRAAGGRIRVHLGLFLATVYTTTVAGASMAGAFPPAQSVLDLLVVPFTAISHPSLLIEGLPFSVALLLILFVHEMGHYLASRKWQVRATLPYFIPFPFMIGTLGAVIRIRSRIPNKRALLDIGTAGPIAGFVMSIVAIAVGLRFSETVQLSEILPGSLSLGDSLVFSWLASVVVGELPAGTDLYMHPIAFAGWLGLFVTVLNLLPVGQFDGGHVVYAVFGGRVHQLLSRLTVVFLALFWALGPPYGWIADLDALAWLQTRWPGWLVWILIALALGLRHPPPFDSREGLNGWRQVIGFIALVVFVICFIPRPFSLSQ